MVETNKTIIYILFYVFMKQYVTIEARRKEHMRHFRLGQPEKSVVAQHAIETGHIIEFNNTTRLARTKGYMDRIVKEAIEIQIHPNNINKEGGYMLSRAWRPVLRYILPTQGLRPQ
jgi:hypothetical protein